MPAAMSVVEETMSYKEQTHALRLAIIGVGIAGQSHLLDAITASGINVVAVCASQQASAAQVASDFGIAAAYSDVSQMLREQQPEAVVVATPPSLLALHTAACLEAHADVLVEKPLAASQRDLNRISTLLSSSGRRLVVAYTRRYRRAWYTASRWLSTGRIGSVNQILCHWQGPYRWRYAPTASTYRANPAKRVAGILLDSGSHILDALLYLTGQLGTIISAALEIDELTQADVAARIVLQQSSGVRVSIIIEDGYEEEQRLVTIQGQSGTITLDEQGATLTTAEDTIYIPDGYRARPVDDLLSLRHNHPIHGTSFEEACAIVTSLLRIYERARHPLLRSPRWFRPRAKVLARLSGAC